MQELELKQIGPGHWCLHVGDVSKVGAYSAIQRESIDEIIEHLRQLGMPESELDELRDKGSLTPEFSDLQSMPAIKPLPYPY